jgi:hypothetical protein
MSLDIDNKNINEDDDLVKFKKHAIILMKKCNGTQNNIIFFDFLVETQNLWKKRIVEFDPLVKIKLLKYKKITETFPCDKYLKLLGYCCSYKTHKGILCKYKPVNGICGICILHKKFDSKLKLNVTNNTPLIKDLHNIIIAYIR